MTDRILIRPLRREDAEDLYRIITLPEVARNLLQLPSMALAETLAHVQNHRPEQHRLVAQVGQEVVGNISLTLERNPRRRHAARLGMYVSPALWNQGIGSRLMAAALDIADNWLNLKRVELEVMTDNVAAVHLYQKFGFAIEGCRRYAAYGGGRWADEYVMARLSPDFAAQSLPPAPPLSLERKNSGDFLPLTIRPPRREDFDGLYHLFRQPAVCRGTSQIPSMEIDAIEQRFDDNLPGMYRYVALVDDQVVGHVSLWQPANPRLQHTGGLGLMVHQDYWNQRIGSQLMDRILDLADNWLNLKRVELDVFTDNPAAVRLYEKKGFAHEGIRRFFSFGDGRWAHSHFMARIRSRE